MIILAALMAASATVPRTQPPPALPAAMARTTEMPSRAEVLAAVKAEWPRYDTAGRGRLTPLQFSTWVIRANGGSVAERAHGKGISPVSAMNATARAFAAADANHDGGVTPEEMTRFLMMTPAPTAIDRSKLEKTGAAKAGSQAAARPTL